MQELDLTVCASYALHDREWEEIGKRLMHISMARTLNSRKMILQENGLLLSSVTLVVSHVLASCWNNACGSGQRRSVQADRARSRFQSISAPCPSTAPLAAAYCAVAVCTAVPRAANMPWGSCSSLHFSLQRAICDKRRTRRLPSGA